MAKTAGTIVLAVAISLVACTQALSTVGPPTQTTVPTPASRSSPTAMSTPTPTPSPSPGVSPTPMLSSPTLTNTPALKWALLQDFSGQPGGVRTIEVLPRGTTTFVGLGLGCPIEISSFQVDLQVIDTGYAGPWYSVNLRLPGLGTTRSWHAQIGYHSEDGHLGVHCQAYSYSNRLAGRFWQDIERPVEFGEWHTFKIEVVPTGEGWQYAFRYLLDGEDVCYYQPPDRWDGDNRYEVHRRGVQIWVDGDVPSESPSIRVLLDNHYGY